LSIADSFKLSWAIAKSLTREEALNILDTDETINSTYERQGAFNWTFNNVHHLNTRKKWSEGPERLSVARNK